MRTNVIHSPSSRGNKNRLQPATHRPEIVNSRLVFARYQEPVGCVLRLLKERGGVITATEMSDLIALKERQARKVFRLIAGETFRLAQLRARLSPAQALVRYTSTPFADIAYDFGYSTRAKFDKSYLSLFRITPFADRQVFAECRSGD